MSTLDTPIVECIAMTRNDFHLNRTYKLTDERNGKYLQSHDVFVTVCGWRAFSADSATSSIGSSKARLTHVHQLDTRDSPCS
jgi:hypothetical protein